MSALLDSVHVSALTVAGFYWVFKVCCLGFENPSGFPLIEASLASAELGF